MADRLRPSIVCSKKNPNTLGYSTFDPGGSIDSGLSDKYSSTSVLDDAIAVEGAGESVSISWENIDVFVKVPGPSFLKRLCFGTEEHEKPTRKQVLYNCKFLFLY